MIYTEQRPGMNWFLCIKVYVCITIDCRSTYGCREAERSSTEKRENRSTCSFTRSLRPNVRRETFNLWLFSRLIRRSFILFTRADRLLYQKKIAWIISLINHCGFTSRSKLLATSSIYTINDIHNNFIVN